MARRKAQTYGCPRSFWDRGGRLSAAPQSRQQNDPVAARAAEQQNEIFALGHVPGDDRQNRAKCCEGQEAGKRRRDKHE
jgi:hypothetical protein